jgi:hypothetical protein
LQGGDGVRGRLLATETWGSALLESWIGGRQECCARYAAHRAGLQPHAHQSASICSKSALIWSNDNNRRIWWSAGEQIRTLCSKQRPSCLRVHWQRTAPFGGCLHAISTIALHLRRMTVPHPRPPQKSMFRRGETKAYKGRETGPKLRLRRYCARIAKAAIQAVADRSPHAALRTKVGCAQKVCFAKSMPQGLARW